MSEFTELPAEPAPERTERLRLHNYRNRGGRHATSTPYGSSPPGRPEHEHAKLLSQFAAPGKPFKPYVWRDPARTGRKALDEAAALTTQPGETASEDATT